jgi:glycosyltransferase involved in cell wall biosynthesis
MIASLRDYKGVPVLMSLARHFAAHSAFKFVLVANDSNERVAEFRLAQDRANVEIVDATDSPEVYYQSASILMNLSNPDEWIETFGLTLIEAMAFGVPVIAPPIGGPTEIVRHGVDGYLIDSRNFDQLTAVLTQLSRDDERLLELSAAARERAGSFSPERYQERVLSEIEGVLANV